MMLGAHLHFQHFLCQINAVIPIQLDGGFVHRPQAFNRRLLGGSAVDQIVSRLFADGGKIIAGRVAAEVHEHLSAQIVFLLHQHIHPGGTLHLRLIKGPLIPLEEGHVHGFCFAQLFHKEFMLRAVFLHGDVPGYHLLIAARHIPAEFHGSQSVLPPIQIFSFCSGKEGYAAHAELAHGIHTGTVDRRRAAGAQHHMGAPNQHPFLLRSVQAEQTLHAFFAGNDAAGHGMIRNRHMPCLNALLQCFSHVAAGQRPCAGGTATKVVIRLIAHIFPVIIHRKRHTQGSQLQEALCRACRLA